MDVEQVAASTVIGAVFLDPECVVRLHPWLQPAHFPDPFSASVYAAQVSLWADREHVDVVAVLGRLGSVGQVETTLNALLSFAESAMTSVNVEHHGLMLLEAAKRRRLAGWADSVRPRLGRAPFGETDKLVEALLAEANEITQGNNSVQRVGAARVAADTMDYLKARVEAVKSGKILGLPTGMAHLDAALCGLEGSEFMLLTGKTGSGKTVCMLNMCIAAAKARDKHVSIASLEMPPWQLMTRIYASEAGVDAKRMRSGNLTGWDMDAIESAQTRIHALDPWLSFISRPGLTAAMLDVEARKLNRGKGPSLGVLAVDYVQLVEPSNPTAPREQQVSRISKDLLRIAQEQTCCVLALSQLNDDGQVRESKALLHDATTWLNLDMDDVPDDAIAQTGRLKILKQRHGATSFSGLPVVFIRNQQRFGAQEGRAA